MMIPCNKCGKYKSISDYFPRGRICKDCHLKVKRLWVKNNLERVRKSKNKWSNNNKEAKKRWRDNNPDKIREYNKKQSLRPEVKERNKEYAKLHPEKIREYQRRYRLKHPEKIREYQLKRNRYEDYGRPFYFNNGVLIYTDEGA